MHSLIPTRVHIEFRVVHQVHQLLTKRRWYINSLAPSIFMCKQQLPIKLELSLQSLALCSRTMKHVLFNFQIFIVIALGTADLFPRDDISCFAQHF
mmetsp:Transcript_20735/g.62504  ORF Transcript_20735/g.62504 Transcript_20735/m.62504 type:complete len:96 (+) Transcript_20735:340-627(+)